MRMDVVWWAACVGTSIGDILFDDGLWGFVFLRYGCRVPYFDINQRQPGWSSDSTYIYCAIAVEIFVTFRLCQTALYETIPKRHLTVVNRVFSSSSFTAFTWLHQPISGYKAQIKLGEWLPDVISWLAFLSVKLCHT
jgi:hypothetical protein